MRGFAVIRQAISCDICGAEKKQTNHWFVAWETAGELRVSGWNSRNRQRAGSRHLCGQVCLHKLADEFMARVIAGKTSAKTANPEESLPAESLEGAQSFADTSLISPSAHQEIESSSRLIPNPAPCPITPKPQPRLASPLVLPERPRTQPPLPQSLPDAPPRFASRNWRAEAWERERERTQRASDNHRPTLISRRISQA